MTSLLRARRPHSLAVQMGGRDLLFVGDIVDILSGGLCTTDKLIKEQPALVKSMIRAALNTMQAARENRAEAIAFWSQQLKLDTARATAMFDEIPKTMSANGLLSNNGLQALIEAGRLFGAIQGNIDPDRGLDMTLLRQTLKEMGIK